MLGEQNPQVRVFPDIESLSRAAAELFSQVTDRAITERKRLLVALSGGTTPQVMFQILTQPPFKQSIPWEKIHFFWCDERLVSHEHPESNFGQAFQRLFTRVNIPEENLHRIHGEESPAQAVKAYQKELELFSEDDLKWPRFDLAFLGLGADGHTASLFPGAISPAEMAFPVLAVTVDYQGRPAGRVTLTPLVLNSARNLIFMVSGKDKAHAVDQTLHGATDMEKWPVQRIRPVDGKIIWLLDNQAASG
jgi:6-phosphogluconolactonase